VTSCTARHGRVVHVLGVLESQRFFAPADAVDRQRVFGFVFDNCARPAKAYRERLADVAIGQGDVDRQLEVQGRYIEPRHDLFFEAFDENASPLPIWRASPTPGVHSADCQ